MSRYYGNQTKTPTEKLRERFEEDVHLSSRARDAKKAVYRGIDGIVEKSAEVSQGTFSEQEELWEKFHGNLPDWFYAVTGFSGKEHGKVSKKYKGLKGKSRLSQGERKELRDLEKRKVSMDTELYQKARDVTGTWRELLRKYDPQDADRTASFVKQMAEYSPGILGALKGAGRSGRELFGTYHMVSGLLEELHSQSRESARLAAGGAPDLIANRGVEHYVNFLGETVRKARRLEQHGQLIDEIKDTVETARQINNTYGRGPQ